MKPGFFQLQTASDLLQKLGRELKQLEASPNNVDVAFNFFVTAEHIIDWAYCKADHRKKRSEAIPALVSHLASGAKHFGGFEPLRREHQSVEDAMVNSTRRAHHVISRNNRTINWTPSQILLQVKLSDGTVKHVRELAKQVHEYWLDQEARGFPK